MLRRFGILFIALLTLTAAPSAPIEQPSVSAASAVVMDAASGKVLYRKNESEKRAVASTTKIMTCLLACESGRLDETVTVTAAMLQGTEGTSLNLRAGDTLTLRDLVKGAMLASGNDAANAIACYCSGNIDGFVAQMNDRAANIGMKNSHFVTPSGLDQGDHHSTAYDMALLTKEALQCAPLAATAALQTDTITVSGRAVKLSNHNKLLRQDSNFTGFKTGYTKKAGRCLVSTCRYQDSTIICVTLHSPDDWNDHIKLTEYAKIKYHLLSDTVTLSLPLVGAQTAAVRCGYEYDITVCDDITITEYYYPFVYAPIVTGETVGYVELCSSTGELLLRVLLTAQEEVKE